MKLVHTADLHLGYRAYHRANQHGINIREADVARAFREMLDRVADIAPDLLLVAGDVFHTVRPSNAAIADAFRQISHFRGKSADTHVVIVAGNHDSPKAAETGSILRLFGEIDGVDVVHNQARRLALPELDTAILCLPHSELVSGSELAIEPDAAFSHNIVLAHAAVDDRRLKLLMDFGAATLAREAIDPDRWDYVALGHYHLRSRLAPNMFFAGAIERTSLNIWAEADNAREVSGGRLEDTWPEAGWGKGFIEFEFATGRAEFHELDSPREVIDLAPIITGDLTPGELDAEIENTISAVPGGIEEKIVRLRIFDIPREVYRELDHRKIRDYRTRALHFHVVAQPPLIMRRDYSGAPGRRLTLPRELEEYIKHRWRPELDKIDRGALIELGLRYLQRAEEAQAIDGRD
jgi:DNA repair exonuclease SbcCD nuclease subunit